MSTDELATLDAPVVNAPVLPPPALEHGKLSTGNVVGGDMDTILMGDALADSAYGITNLGSMEGGNGKFSSIGKANSGKNNPKALQATGIFNLGSMKGGKGRVVLSGIAEGQSAYGITNLRTIDGGEDDDSVTGAATSTGIQGTGFKNILGSVNLRQGNDLLLGEAIGNSAEGISNQRGTVSGGSGNDTITGKAESTGIPTLIYDPSYAGEHVPLGNPYTSYTAYGISNRAGVINGDEGDDLILGEAKAVDQAYGIFNEGGTINGGQGDDSISGSGTTVGIQGGTIDGGSGDDNFAARRINADGTLALDQGGSVANVLIIGGAGNDVFDVGYGNATLDGGAGSDTLILSGAASDYAIIGDTKNLTISRGGYVLNVFDIENIVYALTQQLGQVFG